MADIFVSYARADKARVAPLVAALEAQGWSVWWDPEITPGQEFDALIANEIRQSRAVVVVWTPASVQSRWVRGEARMGADRGVLAPVSFDAPELPIDARAMHTARFDDWGEDQRSRPFQNLLRALRPLVSGDAHPSSRPPSGDRLTEAPGGGVEDWRTRPKTYAVLVGLVLALIGLAALATFPWSVAHPGEKRIAVLPFEALSSDPAAHQFAEGLSDQILSVLNTRQIPTVSRTDAQTLHGADNGRQIRELGIALLFDGTVQSDGGNLAIGVHLDDARRHATLWSLSYQGPAAHAAELQAQVAARVGAVLYCAGRALRPTGGLSDPTTLSLYLRACDLFQDEIGRGDQQTIYQLLSTLRQVTAQAPGFAAAHSDLAKYAAYFASSLPADQAPQLRAEADREARRALALDPKDADVYVALSMLVPPPGWTERERLLRLGVSADPEWPYANGFLGLVLTETGRLTEGAALYQRAAAANPLNPELGWAPESAKTLAALGRTAQADAAMTSLLKLWPNDSDVWVARYSIALYEGRWEKALIALDDASRPSSLERPDVDAQRAFLLAAKSRTPASIATARRVLLAYAKSSPEALAYAVLSLSALGLVDDAFDLTKGHDKAALGSDAYVFLFVPPADALRRDPRFMALAARIGLVDYWRSTGEWPDFCFDPRLPYDCKAEAAKLAVHPPG